MPEPFSLTGARIVIIGATGGIGRACVEVASGLGAEVWLIGRDSEKLAAIGKGPAPGGSITCDLELSPSIVDAVGRLPELHGVIFAAGVSLVRPLRVCGDVDVRRIMAVNYEGPVLFCRELMRQRKLADGSSIVFVGSIAGHIGAIGHTLYSGSKGALAAFVRSLALELAPRRIRVNTLSPGLVQTDMAARMNSTLTKEEAERYAKEYPLGLGQPEDVARVASFLLSPAARWITGTDLVLDGGISIR